MSGAVVHTPKLLKRSELIFFLLCLIHACCQIPDVLAHCYLHDAAWHIFKTTNSSTYLLHWVSMFAIFYLRLRLIFRGSPAELHRCYDWICILMIVSITSLFTIAALYETFDALTVPHYVFILFAITILIVLPMYAIMLGTKYLQKLFYLNKQIQRYANSVTAMTRYTLLAFIGISCSMAVMFASVAIIASGLLPEPWDYIYQHGCQSINVLVDTMCVSLAMPMHTTYYNYLCKRCDKRCKRCCSRCSEKNADLNLARAMAAELNSNSKANPSSTGTSSPVASTTKTATEVTDVCQTATEMAINAGDNLSEATGAVHETSENVPELESKEDANESRTKASISPMEIDMGQDATGPGAIPPVIEEEPEREQAAESADDANRGQRLSGLDNELLRSLPQLGPELTVTNGSNMAIIH